MGYYRKEDKIRVDNSIPIGQECRGCSFWEYDLAMKTKRRIMFPSSEIPAWYVCLDSRCDDGRGPAWTISIREWCDLTGKSPEEFIDPFTVARQRHTAEGFRRIRESEFDREIVDSGIMWREIA